MGSAGTGGQSPAGDRFVAHHCEDLKEADGTRHGLGVADVALERADDKQVAWLAIAEDRADGEELCRVALLGAWAVGLDEGDVCGTNVWGHDGAGEGTVGADDGAGARHAASGHTADDAVYGVAVLQCRGGVLQDGEVCGFSVAIG